MNFYAYVGNNPVNLVDPWGWDAKKPIFKQFLEDLSEQSQVAGVASALAGQAYLAATYYGVSAVAVGLNVSIYSGNKVRDTVVEIVKMIIPAKEPFNLLADKIVDFLNKGLERKPMPAPQLLPAH